MPTYIYETTDPAKPIRTFEVKQSVHDEPLRSDPETGEGARRVISAGYNLLIRGKSVGPSVGSVAAWQRPPTSFSGPPWRLRPVALSSEPRCWLSPFAVPCASDSLSEICRP